MAGELWDRIPILSLAGIAIQPHNHSPSPTQRAPSLILLAFLLPFSIYLSILGSINRRRHPVMVSGVTDFIGILFAASGFLLFGGPGILTGLGEEWRMFWLIGKPPGSGATGFWE